MNEESATPCDKECGAVAHLTGGEHRTDCAAYGVTPTPPFAPPERVAGIHPNPSDPVYRDPPVTPPCPEVEEVERYIVMVSDATFRRNAAPSDSARERMAEATRANTMTAIRALVDRLVRERDNAGAEARAHYAKIVDLKARHREQLAARDATIATLTAEMNADKALVRRVTTRCLDCPEEDACETCGGSGVIPIGSPDQENEIRSLTAERDALAAHELAVAEAIGVVYEADGHALQAGPREAVVGYIRDARRRSDESRALMARAERLSETLRNVRYHRHGDGAVCGGCNSVPGHCSAWCRVASALAETPDAPKASLTPADTVVDACLSVGESLWQCARGTFGCYRPHAVPPPPPRWSEETFSCVERLERAARRWQDSLSQSHQAAEVQTEIDSATRALVAALLAQRSPR